MIQEVTNDLRQLNHFDIGRIPSDPDADWSYMTFLTLEGAKNAGERFVLDDMRSGRMKLCIRFGLGARMYALPHDDVEGFELAVFSYGQAYNSNAPDKEVIKMNQSFVAHFEKYEIQPSDSFQRTS